MILPDAYDSLSIVFPLTLKIPPLCTVKLLGNVILLESVNVSPDLINKSGIVILVSLFLSINTLLVPLCWKSPLMNTLLNSVVTPLAILINDKSWELFVSIVKLLIVPEWELSITKNWLDAFLITNVLISTLPPETWIPVQLFNVNVSITELVSRLVNLIKPQLSKVVDWIDDSEFTETLPVPVVVNVFPSDVMVPLTTKLLGNLISVDNISVSPLSITKSGIVLLVSSSTIKPTLPLWSKVPLI